MSDAMKHAWGDVAEGFARLGGTMKDRYLAETPGEEGAAGDRTEPAPAPADAVDALRGALDDLIAAGRDVGQRAIDVWRDPEVSNEVRQAATSLNEALGATVDLIGREISNLFTTRRPVGREPATAERLAADEPPTLDAATPAGDEPGSEQRRAGPDGS